MGGGRVEDWEEGEGRGGGDLLTEINFFPNSNVGVRERAFS